LVNHLGIQDSFTFAGRVSISDYLGEIDVLVLTSISEAQPLAILEAGCAAIPAVATDVGACREMIYGDQRETEPLGAGGEVVPLSNPTATAHAIARLCADRSWRESAANAIRRRVELYYNKPALDAAYGELYRHWAAVEPGPLSRQEAA
jgi:glycosyltransferase involved in cell wall biosynthesis